jgi:hypothetical protein
MSVPILTNCYISINSVNLSAYVVKAAPNFKLDEVDLTAMNPTAAKSYGVGLQDVRVEVTLLQDFANSASATDQAINTVWSGKTAVPVEIRPVNATVTTANPKWTGNAFIFEYSPLGDGSVGSRGETSFTLVFSGGVTRGTS